MTRGISITRASARRATSSWSSMNIPNRVVNGLPPPVEFAWAGSPGLPCTYERTRETRAKRHRRQKVHDAIHGVLAKDVLLVHVVVVAVHDQLERLLAGEDRGFGLGLVELDAQRHEGARCRATPEMAARTELDVENRGAARTVHRQESRIVVLALRVPVLPDRLEIGLQRERKRLGVGEQAALLRVDPPRADDVGLGPWFRELFELRVIDRRDHSLLRQQRSRATGGQNGHHGHASNHGRILQQPQPLGAVNGIVCISD